MAQSGSGILCLDLGVNMAACGGHEGRVELYARATLAWITRTRSVKGKKIKETRPWGWRWRSAREALTGWLWAVTPSLVVVEGPGYFKSKDAYRVHYGLHAMVQELALDFGAEWSEVAPSDLKKWATGSGNADKERMLEAAKALHAKPEEVETHDMADARLLYAYALERLS